MLLNRINILRYFSLKKQFINTKNKIKKIVFFYDCKYEIMFIIMPRVDYTNIKEIYEFYEWDSKIGDYGGFEYVKYNKEKVIKPIELSNIGNITICNSNIQYEQHSGAHKIPTSCPFRA